MKGLFLNDPAVAELHDTAREYTLRMVELTSSAAASNVRRELSTTFNWLTNGLTFLRKTAGQRDVSGLLEAQCQLAEDCRDQAVQDVRNCLQIAELTKSELLHWQDRWATVWIRSAVAACQPGLAP